MSGGWDDTPLRHIATSWCDGPFGSGLASEHYTEAGARVVRLQNIRASAFDHGDSAFVDMDYFDKALSRHSVLPGDLLVAGLGDDNNLVGRACVAPDNLGPALVKADCFRFRIDPKKANVRFVAYSLSASAAKAAGELASGSTRSRINLGLMAGRRILLPSSSEQERIANFLDEQTARIDALIAEKEHLAATLIESEASQILALSTGQEDGARGALDPKAPDQRVLPVGWELPQLARVVSKLTNGYVGPTRDILVSEGVRYLQSLHIKSGRIEFSRGEYYVTEEWSKQHAKSVLGAGDVLIVQTGDIGQTALVSDEFVGCNCHALIIATPMADLVNPQFLELVLRSTYGRAAFDLYATGALHPHLNCSNIRDIRIPRPPLRVQQEIVQRAEAVQTAHRELVRHVEAHIDRLREYRSSLIAAAVTGQLDFGTFKEAA